VSDDPVQLIQAHPQLIRMALTYGVGFLLISLIGWFRVYQRAIGGTLRQVHSTPFPLPFSIGLGFFLILTGVLFGVRGYPALFSIVIGYFFLMHQAGRSISNVLGLRRFSFSKIACAALGLGAILFAPVYLISAVNAALCSLLKMEVSAQPLVDEFLRMTDQKSVLSFIAVAVIVAPVTEEILFRGLLYPVLRDQFGIKIAVLISAALFGAAHLHFPTFLPLTFLGIVFAFAYEYSGSLLLTMMMHSLFNLFSVMNLLLLKPYLIP
jgi:membrane protease YdiL (CAAX protease family)